MKCRFRWVFCQLATLENCLDYPAVLNALASLPETLDETYSQILNGLPKSYIAKATRLLQFLAFSERPLQIDEAVDMLAVDCTQRPRFKMDNRMPRPQEIIRYCGSLVVVVVRQIKNTYYGQDETITEIQLAHFSVQTYLVSEQIKDKMVKHLQSTARATIVETCVAYLLELDSMPIKQLCSSYPLAEFAARYWAAQASRLGERSGTTDRLILELLITRPKFQICYRLYAPDMSHEGMDNRRKECYPLYYATFCGLSGCVQELLRRGADVNAHGGYYGSALQAASHGGHLEIVRMLVEKDADINAQGGYYGNALQAASERGHLKVIRILLVKGADVNAYGRKSGNALQAASGRGYLDIVKILLDTGADVNALGEGVAVLSRQLHLEAISILSRYFWIKGPMSMPRAETVAMLSRQLQEEVTSKL